MIVTLISHAAGPTSNAVYGLVRDMDKARLSYQHFDADSPDGAAFAQLYDITRKPAVVVTQDDGVLVQMWQGILPSADELGYTSRK